MSLYVEQTPWGEYHVLQKDEGYLVKVIVVNPHSRTSLQYHNHREESWTVVKGVLRAWWGMHNFEDFSVGALIHVNKKETHRIENPTGELLVIIEVQIGDDLREDDIVRLEDDYGRI